MGKCLFGTQVIILISGGIQRLSNRPLRPKVFTPNNLVVLKKVRAVIEATDVPSWIASVPLDWGSSAAGTPKADQWRSMVTIYFPIALILSWHGSDDDDEGRSRRQLLELTMCLVQATWSACRKRTSSERQAVYLKCMCTYLRNLQNIIECATFRPNHHFSLHLFEFLELWGPVYSWWCFPFERINGSLQRIATNNIFGMLLSLLPT